MEHAEVSDLSELLERAKSATGPDREIDASIATQLLHYEIKRELGSRAWRVGKRKTKAGSAEPWRRLPSYTASTDAALSLADRLFPFGPDVGHEMHGSLARDGEECFTFRIRVYSAEEGEPATVYWSTSYTSYALAILECTLTALLAKETSHDNH